MAIRVITAADDRAAAGRLSIRVLPGPKHQAPSPRGLGLSLAEGYATSTPLNVRVKRASPLGDTTAWGSIRALEQLPHRYLTSEDRLSAGGDAVGSELSRFPWNAFRILPISSRRFLVQGAMWG